MLESHHHGHLCILSPPVMRCACGRHLSALKNYGAAFGDVGRPGWRTCLSPNSVEVDFPSEFPTPLHLVSRILTECETLCYLLPCLKGQLWSALRVLKPVTRVGSIAS